MFLNSIYFRFFILLSIVLGIVGYSKINKLIFDDYITKNLGPILSTLPEFSFGEMNFQDNKVKEEVSSNLLKIEQEGLVVHFWATWCAPCEVELPSFIKLAKSFEDSNVKFLIMAINDEELKVRKFMKRFSADMPSNVILGLDTTDTSSRLLGTVKIPETYVFNSSGLHLRKFVGPQEWDKPYFFDRINNLLK